MCVVEPGAGSILWEFEARDGATVTTGFRRNWQYPDRWYHAVADRIGVSIGMVETGGTKKAAAQLGAVLDVPDALDESDVRGAVTVSSAENAEHLLGNSDSFRLRAFRKWVRPAGRISVPRGADRPRRRVSPG